MSRATFEVRPLAPVCRLAALTILASFPAFPATVVHRPYLQNVGPDHVTILWSTRENLTGELQYTTDKNFSNFTRVAISNSIPYPQSVTHSSYAFFQYRADLSGLSSGTTYFYKILMGGQDITTDITPQFRTTASGPFRFLVYGDSGQGSPEQLKVLNQMLLEQPDLVLHVGDIAYENGTFDEFHDHHFEYYFSMMAHIPFYPVPGNHEYYSCDAPPPGQRNCPPASPFLALHAPPTNIPAATDFGRYFSFDWGEAHFVALDANLLPGYGSTNEMAWLEQDLAASTAKWKIAYWHQTPYPLQHHIDDILDISARQMFVPIIERHGVQLVLTGHEHEYFRTKPMRGDLPVTSGPATLYVTSGGGGGPLHPVVPQPWVASGCTFPPAIPSTGSQAVRPPDAAAAKLCEATWWHYLRVEVTSSQIVIHAIDLNGVEFDTVALNATPSISPGGVVNTASYTPDLAPGSLVSIFGQSLAAATQTASQYPLPSVLSGTSVTLNGTPLSLFYVSAGQINAQLPLDFVGAGTLQVTTATGTASASATVSTTAPAVFQSGVLHHTTGAPVTTTSPATAGEILDVYLTGLGQVNGSLTAGQPAPASPPLSVVATVAVDIGTASLMTPIFSGLTPGLAGVYQVSVGLPPDLPTNTYPLRVITKGGVSNTENIPVRARTP
ncbi:MAG TPA: metallophosphoesterase [Candidatus Acidoferrales bacterium]|nr:metallophosphoesterase [Candidatus Acidoferrales bacterium]